MKKLYIGNLPYQATEADLQSWFGQAGITAVAITMMRDRYTGEARGFGLFTVGQHYFDWHHTRTDTVDKVNPQDFRQCVAAMAVMSYVLADMPDRLGE